MDATERYTFGNLRSADIKVFIPEEPVEVYRPTLEFHFTTATLVCRKSMDVYGVQQPLYSTVRSFVVPLDDLENLKQCEGWIKLKLISLGTMSVKSDIGSVIEQLVGLVWKMRERVQAGEMCFGVIKMDVVRVMHIRRRVVETWTEVMEKKFKAEKESCTCAICLEDIEGSSAVVELLCHHGFHSKCIEDWLMRKTNCPCCRKRVYISYKLEPRKTADNQFQFSVVP